MSYHNSVINTVPGKASRKLVIIDQSTYEQFHKESKTTHNITYKKTQQIPNLGQFIKSKPKPKKTVKRAVYTIYKKGKKPVRKCKRRCSKLKQCILKYRLLKKNAHTRESKQNVVVNTGTEEIAESFESLTLRIPNRSGIHSRRFREYCDNTTSEELSNHIETILRELYRFQKRAFLCNEYKARSRRRIVIGFREVQAQMIINKLKLVVIATDCEICDLPGGLDKTIISIREDCRNRAIPCAFALQRRQLSYALFKKSPISCVGILDYDGVQDIFLKMLNILELQKRNYKCLLYKQINATE